MKIKSIVLIALSMMIVSLFAVPVFAHNRVVVVPLSGAVAKSSGGEWIEIYDHNDNFFGYALGCDMIISSKKYFTYTPRPHYGASGGPTYLSTDCSGIPYVRTSWYPMGPFSGPGRVLGRSLNSTTSTFYIPQNASSISVSAGTNQSYYFDGNCNSSTLAETENFYEVLPNNPNITGFPDTVSGPLKAVYTLPSSP